MKQKIDTAKTELCFWSSVFSLQVILFLGPFSTPTPKKTDKKRKRKKKPDQNRKKEAKNEEKKPHKIKQKTRTFLVVRVLVNVRPLALRSRKTEDITENPRNVSSSLFEIPSALGSLLQSLCSQGQKFRKVVSPAENPGRTDGGTEGRREGGTEGRTTSCH